MILIPRKAEIVGSMGGPTGVRVGGEAREDQPKPVVALSAKRERLAPSELANWRQPGGGVWGGPQRGLHMLVIGQSSA